MKRLINILGIVLIISGCDLIQFKKQTDGVQEIKPVARVKDKYLYPADLAGLAGASDDSVLIAEQFVKGWIKKQLVISEAETNLEVDETELERKVLDYRYALIIHEFEKNYINTKLNTDVSDEEIVDYYNNNLSNFELKQHIVKCHFIELPLKAPKLAKFKRLIVSNSAADREELLSYCARFAFKAHLDDTVWVNFDDIIINSPFSTIPNKVEFLQRNRYTEMETEESHYFLRIFSYKISDETSPLEFVKDDIKKIIINKRKVALAKALEKEIYDKAKRNNDFEIF